MMIEHRLHPRVQVGECLERVANCNPSVSLKNQTFNYLDIASVDRQTKTVTGATQMVGVEAPSRARQIVCSGDVLVSTVRPNLNAVARVGEQYHNSIASTGFCVLRPKAGVLNSDYLLHWVKSAGFIDDMVARATGANYPAVSDKTVKTALIPLPPIEEQKRIADTLNKANELRRKDQELLLKYDELTQSIYYEMFGDPVLNDREWEGVKISDLTAFMTSGSRGWSTYYAPQGDLFIRINNVVKGKLVLEDVVYVNAPENAEAKRTRLQPGDVLLSITAALGRTAVVPDNIGTAYINQHLALLRFKSGIEPAYVAHYLSTPGGQLQIQRNNKGGVKAGLNFSDILGIEVLIPPLNLQREFVAAIRQIEKLSSLSRANIAASQSLFDGLLNSSFPSN